MFEDIDRTIFLRLTISKNLKLLRKKHSITQVELADRTGISRSVIARCESCQSSISLENLLIICKALDESPNTVLEGWEKIF